MYINGLTFFMIYFVPELQVHPFNLFKHIAALEFAFMNVYLHSSQICGWKLNYLLLLTTWQPQTCDSLHGTAEFLLEIVSVIQVFTFYALNLMSACLSLDLVLMIHNPFKSSSNREKLIIWFTYIGATFFLVVILNNNHHLLNGP
jgi:hypothetical protein